MPRKNTRSRVLRQLAEELLQRIAGDVELTNGERDDFVTALVRQWITYDGHATAFLGDRQFYLVLGHTPLGEPVVVPEPALHGWARQLTEQWKVDPDDLPGVFEQLNRGQRAEIVNGDGTPLRLWVNPKEQSRGVEPLVKEAVPPGWKRDHLGLAARAGAGVRRGTGPGRDGRVDPLGGAAVGAARRPRLHLPRHPRATRPHLCGGGRCAASTPGGGASIWTAR